MQDADGSDMVAIFVSDTLGTLTRLGHMEIHRDVPSDLPNFL